MHDILKDELPPLVPDCLIPYLDKGNANDIIDYGTYVCNPSDPKASTGWWEGLIAAIGIECGELPVECYPANTDV